MSYVFSDLQLFVHIVPSAWVQPILQRHHLLPLTILEPQVVPL